MASDLFVVGLDLATGREAYVEDASIEYWRAKSYSRGDSSLVCLYCHAGIDAPVGSRIPLVVKHRVGGQRRAHFSHPPGCAPSGGHNPETLWHSAGKHLLARWAGAQPQVMSAVPERYVTDGARRADVDVHFSDGTRLALELQSHILTDQDWEQRHGDYVRSNITDVWLWSPSCPEPWIVAKHGGPVWFFDLPKRELGTLVGQAHQRLPNWFAGDDLYRYADHVPPCVGDDYVYYRWPLYTLQLDIEGITLPGSLTERIARDRESVTADASIESAKMKNRLGNQTLGFSRQSPEFRQLPQSSRFDTGASGAPGDSPPAGSKERTASRQPQARCDLCGIRLADTIAHLGRHPDCEQQRLKRQGGGA